MPLQTRELGLDLLNFFTANVQTGFGPFISGYLTSHKWTQGEIGFALSIGTLAAMVSQIPAGLLLDTLPYKRTAASSAILAIALCALLLGIWPIELPVMIAEILHGFASCMITPAVAALSLAVVGQTGLGERLGRNARWGAMGNALAACLLGVAGHYLSEQSMFWITAGLCLPAAASLILIGPTTSPPKPLPTPTASRGRRELTVVLTLMRDRRLQAFTASIILFQLANAAAMPLAAAQVTERAGSNASLLIAGAILVPQIVMALISPAVGRQARAKGFRLILLAGFASVPVRVALLAWLPSPFLLVPVQALDGISAAVFGVMLPLIAAELTNGKEGFNLCISTLGLASGLGGMLSTFLAGRLADYAGLPITFLTLAACGVLCCLTVWLAMPDNRPDDQKDYPEKTESPVA